MHKPFLSCNTEAVSQMSKHKPVVSRGPRVRAPAPPASPSQVLPSLLSTRPTPHSQRCEFLRFTQISLQPPLFCSHSFSSVEEKPHHRHIAEQPNPVPSPWAESDSSQMLWNHPRPLLWSSTFTSINLVSPNQPRGLWICPLLSRRSLTNLLVPFL